MSEEPRQSHAMTWTVGVGAALLLYLLSWGPVKVHYVRYHDVGSLTLILDGAPGWVKAFYSPVELLRTNQLFGKPSDDYLNWCYRINY